MKTQSKVYIVSEKDVAKKIYLDKRPWKRKVVILFLTIIFILSIVLIWGYAFKGILYLQTKSWVKEFYLDTAVNMNSEKYSNSEMLTRSGKLAHQRFSEDIARLYRDKSQKFRYLDSYYQIESNSGKENNEVYYIITNNSFRDSREHVAELQRFGQSIFYKFVFTSYLSLKLDDILYKISDFD